MAISHGIVALNSSTAVALNTDTVTQNSVTGENYAAWARCTLSVQNVDLSATVYLGGSGVTSSSYGVQLAPGATASLDDLGQSDTVYAISTGSSSVAVLQYTR